MLRRFFSPRWQHRNAEVRERAVAELDPASDEALSILATLARGDASEQVRAAATSRLQDFQLLDEIIHQDRAASVRDSAAARVCALLAGTAEQSPIAENRLRMIRLTDNQQVLLHVARESPDPKSRLAAIDRLEAPQRLFELAVHAPGERERLAAAQRLEEPELLRRLVREGRDKRVLRHARERLKALQQAEQEHERRERERAQLLEQLDTWSRRTPDSLYRHRLGQLERQWRELADDAPQEQQQQARALLEACTRQLAEHEQLEQTQRETEQAHRDQQNAIEQLRALREQIDPETWEHESGNIRAAVATQRRRWENAITTAEPDETARQHFATLLESWERALDLFARLRTTEEGETAQPEAAPEELAGQWPEDIPAPASLSARPEVVEQAPPAQPDDDRFRPVLAGLHRELRQRNLRQVNRLWHRAEKLLEERDNPEVRRRLEKLRPERDELRDWHDFAASPKKEELCRRMEELAATEMDPPEKATAVQALHEEWRALMSSDQEADQALWDRFRQASDRAYEPCREHFRELDAERAANLEKRAGLCDQLHDFIEQQDWDHADWSAVWEIRRRAPEEWHQYEPVRFTDAREVGQRFSALLRELDRRLDEASARHAEDLERLTAEAEALAEKESPEEAVEAARTLQQRWKQAGWVLPRQYRPLNKRFRRACDRIFAARDENRRVRREEFEQQAATLKEALDQLASLLDAPVGELDTDALGRQLETVTSLPCPPREKELERRRDELRDRARHIRRELPRWHQWHQCLQQFRNAPASEDTPAQRELAVAAEVLAGLDSPEDAREERMAWQLEQLPRAMKGSDKNEPALAKVLQVLKDSSVTPENGLDPALRERLMRVLESLEPKL